LLLFLSSLSSPFLPSLPLSSLLSSPCFSSSPLLSSPFLSPSLLSSPLLSSPFLLLLFPFLSFLQFLLPFLIFLLPLHIFLSNLPFLLLLPYLLPSVPPLSLSLFYLASFSSHDSNLITSLFMTLPSCWNNNRCHQKIDWSQRRKDLLPQTAYSLTSLLLFLQKPFRSAPLLLLRSSSSSPFAPPALLFERPEICENLSILWFLHSFIHSFIHLHSFTFVPLPRWFLFPPFANPFFTFLSQSNRKLRHQYTKYLKSNEALRKEEYGKGKFCVIGAGFSGLSICGALARWNIPFDCFEADDAIGGNWYHGGFSSIFDFRYLKISSSSFVSCNILAFLALVFFRPFLYFFCLNSSLRNCSHHFQQENHRVQRLSNARRLSRFP